MVLFPSLYQAAGWLLVTIALVGVCFLSYLCSIMIIEVSAAQPPCSTTVQRSESSRAVRHSQSR